MAWAEESAPDGRVARNGNHRASFAIVGVIQMKPLQFFASITLMFALVAGSDAADKIVADFGGLGAFQSTTWVAKDLQIFDKYGLNVDLVMITGGARSVGALLGGSTQFSGGSAT